LKRKAFRRRKKQILYPLTCVNGKNVEEKEEDKI
jgi:hypothetical protein